MAGEQLIARIDDLFIARVDLDFFLRWEGWKGRGCYRRGDMLPELASLTLMLAYPNHRT